MGTSLTVADLFGGVGGFSLGFLRANENSEKFAFDLRLLVDVDPTAAFTFPKRKLAVFVDGCFWHGCASHCRMPKGHIGYWNPKIASNKARDRHVNRALRRAGWRVFRVWEHELRKPDRVLNRIRNALADS